MPTKHSNTPAITFTLDVEDHRPGPHAELRFPHLTREVLAFLAERNIVGTFFIVGSMAAEHPDLVAEIAAAGHEIGLHSWQHVPITSMTPEQFATDIGRGKDVIEQMISAPVVGYRAPTYSLTPKVSWATDILTDLGFSYSSSVLPGKNPLFSWPGISDEPFIWPSGLIEFPGFLYGIGPVRLPMFGGVYGRVLPMWFLKRGFAEMAHRSMAHMYCHPYDFDPGERFYVLPDVGPLMSPLLWVGRRRWYRRVEALMANPAPPFAARLDEVMARQPVPHSDDIRNP